MKRTFKTIYNYFEIFLIAFLIFGVSIIPSIINSDGIWVYYGDFNVQQIPFYMHVQSAVREGKWLYDWSTDLGGSFLGCYAFYLTGSPFFWLSCLFKTELIPYLMPWLSALKYAVMATTAYAYMSRHLRTEGGAFMGALLYSFSGFQGAVLAYNHFHDVMAFFPLYLVLFELMMEGRENGKGYVKRAYIVLFTLMTAFMVILNYYFFVGEVVFLGVYFIAKYACSDDTVRAKLSRFLRALLAGATGVLLAGIYIVPAIYYTMGNSRIAETLNGNDLVAYSEPTMPLAILKSIFLLPDLSGLNSMFNQSYSRVSGIAAYIPMFSLAGVIAFFLYYREKCWQKRVLVISAVCAAVPMLNQLFSALNSEYYARWFYMPILVMALLTASMLEDRVLTIECLKKGARVVGIATAVCIVCSVLPAKTEEGTWTILGALHNPEQLICELIFSTVMVCLMLLYLYKLAGKSDLLTRMWVVLACLLTTCTMLTSGWLLVDNNRRTSFIEQALKGESPLNPEDAFFRVETDEDFYNYPMLWDDAHSVTSFISTIPSSTLDFYASQEKPRKVTSTLWTSRCGARTLLSCKYYIIDRETPIEIIGHIEDVSELKNYSQAYSKAGYELYENQDFVPMGFTFDEYLTETEYTESDASAQGKDKALMRFIILPDDVAAKYDSILEHGDPTGMAQISALAFSNLCNERRETCCDTFETSHKGFTATVTMEKENLLFFSVPYETGFTAYVDGKECEIVKADYGFMAVMVPGGAHKIEFKYELSNWRYGAYASLVGALLLLGIILCARFKNYRKEISEEIAFDA